MIVRGNQKEMEEERDMCEALYELFEDELKEREAKGEARGIKTLIETCSELGATRPDTLKRLMNKLSLSEEAAEDYMKKYWK